MNNDLICLVWSDYPGWIIQEFITIKVKEIQGTFIWIKKGKEEQLIIPIKRT